MSDLRALLLSSQSSCSEKSNARQEGTASICWMRMGVIIQRELYGRQHNRVLRQDLGNWGGYRCCTGNVSNLGTVMWGGKQDKYELSRNKSYLHKTSVSIPFSSQL